MFNDRSFLMHLRVHVKSAQHRFYLHLFFSLYTPYQLILSCDALLDMIPGRAGRRARLAMDAVSAIFVDILKMPPQEMINVDVENDKDKVKIKMNTIGFSDEGGDL